MTQEEKAEAAYQRYRRGMPWIVRIFATELGRLYFINGYLDGWYESIDERVDELERRYKQAEEA